MAKHYLLRMSSCKQHGLKISARVTVHEAFQPTEQGSFRLTARLKDGLIDDLQADPSHPRLERSLAGLAPHGDDARNAVHHHGLTRSARTPRSPAP